MCLMSLMAAILSTFEGSSWVFTCTAPLVWHQGVALITAALIAAF